VNDSQLLLWAQESKQLRPEFKFRIRLCPTSFYTSDQVIRGNDVAKTEIPNRVEQRGNEEVQVVCKADTNGESIGNKTLLRKKTKKKTFKILCDDNNQVGEQMAGQGKVQFTSQVGSEIVLFQLGLGI
jgi:hypothetical protein